MPPLDSLLRPPRSFYQPTDVLDDSNYADWKYVLKRILIDRGLWEVTAGNDVRPEPDTAKWLDEETNVERAATEDEFKRLDREWSDRNESAITQITLASNADERRFVRHLVTAREVWNDITARHDRRQARCRSSLYTPFYKAKMQPGESLTAMAARIRKLYNKIIDAGGKLTDQELVDTMIRALSDSEEHSYRVPALICHTSFDSAGLEAFFEMEEELEASASRDAIDHDLPPTPTSPSSSRPRCSHCSKLGHTVDVCYSKHGHPPGHKKRASAPAAPTPRSRPPQPGERFLALSVRVIEPGAPPLESGLEMHTACSTHMTPDRFLLHSYQTLDPPAVVVGPFNDTIDAVGFGLMRIVSKTGKHLLSLEHVLHVPKLDSTRISMGKLSQDDGIDGVVGGGRWKLTRQGSVIATASARRDGLYRLDADAVPVSGRGHELAAAASR